MNEWVFACYRWILLPQPKWSTFHVYANLFSLEFMQLKDLFGLNSFEFFVQKYSTLGASTRLATPSSWRSPSNQHCDNQRLMLNHLGSYLFRRKTTSNQHTFYIEVRHYKLVSGKWTCRINCISKCDAKAACDRKTYFTDIPKLYTSDFSVCISFLSTSGAM